MFYVLDVIAIPANATTVYCIGGDVAYLHFFLDDHKIR